MSGCRDEITSHRGSEMAFDGKVPPGAFRHRLHPARSFRDFDDGRAESELTFKFYRQATDKIVGISDTAASFLATYF